MSREFRRDLILGVLLVLAGAVLYECTGFWPVTEGQEGPMSLVLVPLSVIVSAVVGFLRPRRAYFLGPASFLGSLLATVFLPVDRWAPGFWRDPLISLGLILFLIVLIVPALVGAWVGWLFGRWSAPDPRSSPPESSRASAS